MGLISRVSSRTYRKNLQKFPQKMKIYHELSEKELAHLKIQDEEEEEDDEDEDEELFDPLNAAREKCSNMGAAKAWKEELKTCNARVEERGENTTETCTSELFHFLKHRDECVAKKFDLKKLVKSNF